MREDQANKIQTSLFWI